MGDAFKLLSMRPLVPPSPTSWGGECLAHFAFRTGAIVVGAARLLRRADGTLAVSLAAGARGTLSADADFKADLMAAALRVYEAKTAPRAPAQPPFATAIIARDEPHDIARDTGAARRHRHRAAQRRS